MGRGILMLEPRRLATRAAACRLAEALGESPGERIGYAVRHEQRSSSITECEVVTTGLFLRRLQSDPELSGIGCVIFDEFHERGRDNDLALALVRDVRHHLRPDLRLLLMSATLNLESLVAELSGATVLTSAGRSYPVTTHHLPPRAGERLSSTVIRALEQHALPLGATELESRHQPPTVLVFLPGLHEIDQCERAIQECSSLEGWQLCSLHGQQPLEVQARALTACSSEWLGRIVLATAIAESSLTLHGVRLVIDSGLSRRSRYDPETGMEGLETVPTCLASADQRRGRAGRQAPGQCVRLWSPAEQQRRPEHDTPELLRCDPQPLVLDLALWGAGLGEQLHWLDPPPRPSLQEGLHHLVGLGALTPAGLPSDAGRQLAGIGTHPRLGMLLLHAREWKRSRLGADLAALLSERDPLNSNEHGSDLGARLQLLKKGRNDRIHSIRQLSRQLYQQLEALPALRAQALPHAGQPPAADCSDELVAALLLATAFPEWVALQRAERSSSYQLRQGRGAVLTAEDPLQASAALAVARLDLGRVNARIRLALPLPISWLEDLARREGEWQETVALDEGRVRSRRNLQLGALTLQSLPQQRPDPELACSLLLDHLGHAGLETLPWGPRSQQLRERLALLHQHRGLPWPARDWESLARDLPEWLGPSLLGCTGLGDFSEDQLIEALWGEVSWQQRQSLNQLLPESLLIPSGRQARLDYRDGEVCLAVKLQEMFGCLETPRVLEGRLPVTLELLSPAGRPLQRTQDLEGFWRGSYHDVRRDMRGRYPKHPWPDNPATAIATAGTNKRR